MRFAQHSSAWEVRGLATLEEAGTLLQPGDDFVLGLPVRVRAHRVWSALLRYALPNQDGNYGGGGQAKARGDNGRTALLHLFHASAARRVVVPCDRRNGTPFHPAKLPYQGAGRCRLLAFF